MSENKTSKYFKYAIGEIVLVVIGILIALQINNWNENSKIKKEYVSDLKIIKDNLKLDSINLSGNIRTGKKVISYWKSFEVNDTTFINDLFVDYLSAPTLVLDDNGYVNFRDKGTIYLVEDTKMKNTLKTYYITNTGFLKDVAKSIRISAQSLRQHYLSLGSLKPGVSKHKILDQLRNQAPFLDLMKDYIHYCEIMVFTLENHLKINLELSKIIEKEINNYD